MVEENVPPGRYVARAIDAEPGHSSVRNTPQVMVTFIIMEGPYSGHRLYWYGYLTEKAFARTLKILTMCGCTFPTDRLTFDGLGSTDVAVVVTVDPYDGRTKVEHVNALVSAAATDGVSAAIPAAGFEEARRFARERLDAAPKNAAGGAPLPGANDDDEPEAA